MLIFNPIELQKMKKLLTILAVCSVLVSCSDKLDVAPPNSLTDEQIQELLSKGDQITIEMILGGIANNLPRLINNGSTNASGSDGRYNNILGLWAMKNLQANDVVFGNRTLTGFGGDEYRFLDFTSPDTDKNYPYWNYGYNLITEANKMLNLLDDKTVGSNATLKEYKARGLILRAYAYNFLMDHYQDAFTNGGNTKLGVPLYDYYSPVQESKARATAEETYDFIKNDLNTAEQLLNDAGITYTSTISDFDMGVVNYLQTRVALVTGDWNTVLQKSNILLAKYPNLIPESAYGGKVKVINGVQEIRPEQNAFLNTAANPELIFGLPVGEASTNHNAWYNPFGQSYGGLNEGYARIDNRLYNQIATSDVRKEAFMAQAWGDYTYPSNGVVRNIPALTNLKFAATHGIGSDDKKEVGRVGHTYFRASEVLLMKAEAQARLNDENGALATLDILLKSRTKSGETLLTAANYPGTSALTTLQKVQLHTRIEMWGEAGIEFYNNKRWNIAVDRNSSTNHVDKGTYPVTNMTLKLPLSEMLYNDKAVQN